MSTINSTYLVANKQKPWEPRIACDQTLRNNQATPVLTESSGDWGDFHVAIGASAGTRRQEIGVRPCIDLYKVELQFQTLLLLFREKT